MNLPHRRNLAVRNGNGVRPSSGAATLDGRNSPDYPEALEVPALLRPRTGALRLVKLAPMPAPPRPDRRAGAYTSTELLVATALGALVLGAVLSSYVVVSKGLESLANYGQIHGQVRRVLNNFSVDVRAAKAVTSCTTASIAVSVPTAFGSTGSAISNKTVKYWLSGSNLYRSDSSAGETNLLATDIDQLSFSLYDKGGTNTGVLSAAKGIQVNLTLSQDIVSVAQSEPSLSARLDMRNQ